LIFHLGRCYQFTGELKKADAELTKVISLDKDFTKEAGKALETVKKKLVQQRKLPRSNSSV
jgi:hypothetical protein